jgi:hypothetical protein
VAGDDIMVHPMRARRPDGSVGCDIRILIRASALRRLGLHPDQPSSQIGPPYRGL